MAPCGRGARGGRGGSRAVQPAVGSGLERPTQWGRWACRGRARPAGHAAEGARARASACPVRAPLRAEGPAVSWLRCLGAEAGAGRMSSGGRPSGCGGLGGRWEAWAARPAVGRGSKGPTPWGPGACRGRARCAGQAAGGARARVSARPSGAPRGPWDPRLAGSAARGPRPGPGAWVAASTGSSARGVCGVVRAGRPVAGGLTGSPTRRGRRACRGRTQRAGRAAAGVRAGRRRAR